jgi:hypothetical protein
MARVPVAAAARVQPAGSVTVMVWPDFAPVAPAPQPENAPPKVTAGVLGTPKPASKVAETVAPAPSAPTALGLKLAVQGEVANAVWLVLLKTTVLGELAEITTALPTVAATESDNVFRVIPPNEPAAGFVTPRTSNVPLAPFASEHDAPTSVTVRVDPEPAPVAVQPLNPPPRFCTVGVAGRFG